VGLRAGGRAKFLNEEMGYRNFFKGVFYTYSDVIGGESKIRKEIRPLRNSQSCLMLVEATNSKDRDGWSVRREEDDVKGVLMPTTKESLGSVFYLSRGNLCGRKGTVFNSMRVQRTGNEGGLICAD